MAQIPSDVTLPTERPSLAVPDARVRLDLSPLNPRIPPMAFGGGVAQGLQEVGQGANRAADRFGQIAADDVSNQFQDDANKLLHGDPNKMVTNADGTTTPDTGYLGLKGRSALDQRADYEKRLDDLLKNARSKLLTPDQQLQFDTFSRRYRAVIASQMSGHAITETNTWGINVNKATAKNGFDGITANPDNPEIVAHSTSDVINAYTKIAELQGAQPGDPVWNAAIQQGKADAARAQILAIGTKDPGRAAQMTENYKDVLGKDYSVLADHFRARADEEGGISESRPIWDSTAPGGTTGGTPPQGIPVPTGLDHDTTGVGVDAVNKLHDQGINLNFTSGYRTPAANAGVHGARQSRHMSHQAFDIGLSGYTEDQQRAILDQFLSDPRVKGVGWEGDHLHIDTDQNRPSRTAWGKDDTPESLSGAPAWVQDRIRTWQAGADTSQPGTETTQTTDPVTQRQLQNAQRLRSAIDAIDKSNLSIKGKEAAYRMVHMYAAADSAVFAAQEKANREGQEDAFYEYLHMAHGQGGPAAALQKAWQDPRLKGKGIAELQSIIEKMTGFEDPTNFGPGYVDALKNITTPRGQGGRVLSGSDLVQLEANGQITSSGLQRLMARKRSMRDSDEERSYTASLSSLLAGMKNQFTFNDEMALPGVPESRLKDQKAFNTYLLEYVPKVETAYEKARQNNEDMTKFLTKENFEKMAQGLIRSKAERDRDRLMASGDVTPPEPRQVIPAPPDPKMSKDAWETLAGTPPTVTSGKEWPIGNWVAVLNWLRTNPTPENKAVFDHRFSASGYTADDVLKQMSRTTSQDEQDRALEIVKGASGF